jgi:hypothetical protein
MTFAKKSGPRVVGARFRTDPDPVQLAAGQRGLGTNNWELVRVQIARLGIPLDTVEVGNGRLPP